MLKAYTKYLLSLCILLLSVYSQLYAHTYRDGISHSSLKNQINSEQARFGTGQNSPVLARKFVLSVTEKESLKIGVAEIEEEDNKLISFKKYLKNSNYFSTVFYALVFGFLGLFLRIHLPSCKHSLNFPSYKLFLLFRVIRI